MYTQWWDRIMDCLCWLSWMQMAKKTTNQPYRKQLKWINRSNSNKLENRQEKMNSQVENEKRNHYALNRSFEIFVSLRNRFDLLNLKRNPVDMWLWTRCDTRKKYIVTIWLYMGVKRRRGRSLCDFDSIACVLVGKW